MLTFALTHIYIIKITMNIEIIIVQFSNKIPTTVALHLFISLSLSSS